MNTTRIAITALAGVFAVGVVLAQAAPAPAPAAEPQCPMMEKDGQPMEHPAAAMHGAGMHDMGAMPMQCKECKECAAAAKAREAMNAEIAAMDAKLDGLLAKMDAAKGAAKNDAMAAVLHELIAQRKTMRERMEQMQHEGMQAMMHRMHMGMMHGMMEAMGGCPMMKPGEPPHEAH